MAQLGTRTKRQFWTLGTSGQRYLVTETVRLIDVRTSGNLNAPPVEGLSSLCTADGKAVNFLGDGRYESFDTHEVLTEE